MKTASIIVTFNPNLLLLEKQLKSISVFTSVYLVDNASDNIIEINDLCLQICGSIIVIKLDENKGLGFAQNTGIIEALKSDFTHVMLFDQDSFLSMDSYEALIDAENLLIKSGNAVGAIGPICVDPVSKLSYPITEYRGPFIKRRYLSNNELSTASFIVASGSLIRVKVIKDVGLMKDDFFIDYIDVEWCYRAQSMGYKLYATSKSTLEHIIGDSRIMVFGRSISMHSATRRYYLTRNCFRILTLQYIPIGYKIREVSLLFARILTFLYFSNERHRYCRLMMQAFGDAFRGKFGKLKEGI